MKPIIPVMEYIVFYDYIKNELCENKDKPEMHCDGKCYLAKQLAKASETEKDSKEKKQLTSNTVLEFYQELPASFNFYTSSGFTQPKTTAYKCIFYKLLDTTRLLRPPIS
ncbi:hypothetical protein Y10_22370 [Neptunitalea sp. Y10]|uniref:Uncharacterized protein n=2 Tax=Neptunitalea lumnitzerae TaxID=2965509 RepID=A0ABQ5MKF5_9FLAO|nr:hypothetical protein Y10_22370 [Neptunitalea sp. Y10]